MQAALPYIVLIQLVISLGLAFLVFGLARQVGILHERVAPMGALASDHGPSVGEMAPSMSLTTLAGTPVEIGGAQGRSLLLLFIAADCPVCKKLLPIAGSFSQAERLEILLVGDGEPAQLQSMARANGVSHLPLVNSARVGLSFHVGKLPYAVLVDDEGVVRAKGLVNNREHLESLIVAEETGFGSIQAYLAAKGRASAVEAAKSRESLQA